MEDVPRTPRKMRLFIRPQGAEDDPYHPDYEEDISSQYGEMGQVIEWLIFGHMVEPSAVYTEILWVYCWGSNRRMGNLQISINRFAATRLLAARPPVRMGAAALRIFLANMELEEREPQPEVIAGVPLADMEMSDADSQYSGYQIGDGDSMYRRAIQRIRSEEHRAKKGLPPLLGVSRTISERRVDEPLGPPGVAGQLLSAGNITFTVISGLALYYSLSSNPPNWGDFRELVNRFIALQLSYPQTIPILFILLVALFLGFPGGRFGTLGL